MYYIFEADYDDQPEENFQIKYIINYDESKIPSPHSEHLHQLIKPNSSTFKQLKMCFNTVFYDTSKSTSIWTFLVGDDERYANSAIKLLHSIQRNTKYEHKFQSFVIELVERPLSVKTRANLQLNGWNV